MKKHFSKRRMRFRLVSICLLVLTIAVGVLANTVFSSLAEKYSWYAVMNNYGNYDTSEECYSFVQNIFDKYKDAEGNAKEVEILFCNTEENIEDNNTTAYVLSTVKQLASRFDNIKISYHDIFINPDSVRPYKVSYSPITGEASEQNILQTDVIVICDSYYRVYTIDEFFVYEQSDTDNVWAYDGERVLASALLKAVDPETHIAVLLSNHGETYYDYELIYLLDDAGYTVCYLDLYNTTLPANTEIVISYNPNTDLIDDEVAEKSEIEILNNFLSEKDHAFYVFLENGTPQLPNFEAFLSSWGVSCEYDKTSSLVRRTCIKDTSASLTSDGYTVYGEANKNVVPSATNIVYKYATGLSYATSGYTSNGNGTYISNDKTKTMTPLCYSSASSVSYAGGQEVASGTKMLATITEQTLTDGSSYVFAFSSVEFATEAFLQSAVYGNSDFLLHTFEIAGKSETTEGLNIKPFQYLTISTLTTADMTTITICLTVIPVVIIAVVAIVILKKRKNA